MPSSWIVGNEGNTALLYVSPTELTSLEDEIKIKPHITHEGPRGDTNNPYGLPQ